MDTGIDKAEAELDQQSEQPTEDVKTPVEESEATSQADDTEELEVYVEDEEGDQKKPTMSDVQLRAAWKEEQRKRKEKQKLIDAEKERTAKLEKELEEIKAQVGKISKGEPPTLESCGFDEAQFQQATRDYYTVGATEEKPKPQPKPSANEDTEVDNALFYLHQKEVELSKALPDYPKSRAAVESLMKDAGLPDTELAMAYISNIAMQGNVDVAKAVVAIEKKPSIINDLMSAGTNQILAAKIIENAANKVKTRTKKAIDSQPEPSISNKGPINHTDAQIERLRQKYVEDSSAQNFQAYTRAKRNKGN